MDPISKSSNTINRINPRLGITISFSFSSASGIDAFIKPEKTLCVSRGAFSVKLANHIVPHSTLHANVWAVNSDANPIFISA
jgi:hypothetical protein